MQTYEILVRNRAVVANSRDMTLVRTSVGIDQVHVLFDNEEWLDFPITITFSSAQDSISQSVVLNEIDDSDEWVAETTVPIPWEVIDENGSIRVTLQGTDANGRHIITAAGSPLSVEEAGDVVIGDDPEGTTTVDDWQQAYANAMQAVNAAASLVSSLEGRLESIVSDAGHSLDIRISEAVVPATTESLGVVQIGDGLDITNDGLLSVAAARGITDDQASQIANLAALAYYAFDTSFDEDGNLNDDPMLKRSAVYAAQEQLLGAVMPDGYTITADADGTIHAKQYVLPAATTSSIGGVKPDGSTIAVSNGAISVPIATAAKAGIVKPDGRTITISASGTLTASGGGSSGGYILPTASTSQLGGVMVDGETISISEDGVISVSIANADEGSY